MASFTGNRGAFTPQTNLENWILDAGTVAGGMGKVKMINWGGRGTNSTGYRTRWARPTGNATVLTALTVQSSNPLAVSVCRCTTTTTGTGTYPADPSNNLFAQDWNVLGGGGVIVLPIGGEWFIVNSATAGHGQIGCINVAGQDASQSTYGVQWEE